jgi:hypothetical protein
VLHEVSYVSDTDFTVLTISVQERKNYKSIDGPPL